MKTKITLIVAAMFISFGANAQNATHPGTTEIGNYNLPYVEFRVMGNPARGYFSSKDNRSSDINLRNKNGHWHLSGPRYEGKNQFSIFWNNGQNYSSGTYFRYFTITDAGNVGIGTSNPDSKLTVKGKIHAREVKVTVNAGADFVFDKAYNLPSLLAVSEYIKENHHLPEVASAKEMEENGIHLAAMNMKLLQKIEELTLYMIEQEKRIEKLENQHKQKD